MEAIKKEKNTLFSVFRVLFGKNVTTYSESSIKIEDEDLLKVLNKVDEMGKETEKAVHSDNKSSKNGGLGKKINTPTIDVQEISSKKLEEMRRKLEKGIERE